MVNPDGNQEYYIDGYLKSNLDVIKDKVKQDWDFVLIIDGIERGGKSVCGMQIGKYLDPTLTIDNIAFDPKQFEEKVKASPRYKCIIFDEAFSGMASQNYASKINKSLKKMMVEIGQKNLFIILIIPSFFELQRYQAVHRSIALLSIYTGDKLERGYFKFYSKENKARLYFKGRKEYNYKVTKSNFYGRFTNTYIINEEEYRNRKLKCMLEASKEAEAFSRYKIQRDSLLYCIHKEFGLKSTDISKEMKKYTEFYIKEKAIRDIINVFRSGSGE